MFVGQNGAGKSNIIDAIKFVRDALTHGLDQAIADRHGIQNIRQWSPTRPFNITIGIETETAKFSFTLVSSGEDYSISKEEGTFKLSSQRGLLHRHSTTYSYSRDKDGTVSTQHGEERGKEEFHESSELWLSSARDPIVRMWSWHLLNIGSYSIFPNTLRNAQKPSNEAHLLPHGENIASIIKRMRAKKKNEAIQSIISAMQQVVPDLENVTAQALGGFIVPRFTVRRGEGKRHTFDVDQMSDGTLRVLGLLVALYQEPGPEIIALEEPELTVHPGVLELIADVIHEVSSKRQILITTHSPDLLDHFTPEQIIAVEYIDGATRAGRLDPAQGRAVQEKLFTLGEMMSFEGLHG